MITALMIVALLLTALIALSLPWNGWGSGMDAAGRGMAMFFPVIFMGLRFVAFTIALIVLAAGGGLAWTGMPGVAAGLLAWLLFAGMAATSFYAAGRLTNAPRSDGGPQLAFIATIAAPLTLALWLFVERFGATDPAQVWPVRALVLIMALAPIPMILRMERQDAIDAKAADDEDARLEAEAAARAAALPAGAALREILRFHDALAEDDWRARRNVMSRVEALPDAQAQLTAMLSGDWDDKIAAGFHSSFITPAPEGYYEAVQPIITRIVSRLQDATVPPEPLRREARAAIRLAWPAMHTTDLPRALMVQLHAAMAARGETDDDFRNLEHDVKLLAELVNG